MKKSSFALILVLGAIILSFSCSRRVETGFPSLELVDRLVQDSLPSLQRLARLAGGQDGLIVLLGDMETVPAMCSSILRQDVFDNVDARKSPDGLLDFAGEIVSPIVDLSEISYAEILAGSDGKTALKELAIRLSLAALDSCINCKVLVLCSPLMAEYGGDDISDFFEKIGCTVPVIYSADTSFSLSEECFRTMREKNLFTHNISFPEARYYEILWGGDSFSMSLAQMPAIDFSALDSPVSDPDTTGVATALDTTLAE